MFLFDRECTHISEYYFEDGLRKVKPYYHVLELSVPLLKEPITLRDYLLENVVFDVDIQRARFDLELEKFYVNLKPANCQDLLKSGDVIRGEYFPLSCDNHHGIVSKFDQISEKFLFQKSKKSVTFEKTVKKNPDFHILFGLIVHSND